VYGSVERVQLTLPPGEYSAIPELPYGIRSFGDLGGGAVIDTAVVATNAVNTFELSNLQPDLLAVIKHSGPVRGIAIAADSPIACCDLWLGDAVTQNRYRISPGRPWIGDISALDRVLVTVPQAIPNPWDGNDNAETVANFLLGSVMWGASGTFPTPVGPSPRVDTSWPLRLELYRGELPPITFAKRSPMFADAWFALDEGVSANPAFGQVYFATDGRKRSSVTVANRDAAQVACKVTVTGYMPTLAKKQAGQPQSVRRFNCATVLDVISLPAGDTFSRAYDSRFPLMRVRCEPPTGFVEMVASVHITAEDD
jgi:hypothetical protein